MSQKKVSSNLRLKKIYFYKSKYVMTKNYVITLWKKVNKPYLRKKNIR